MRISKIGLVAGLATVVLGGPAAAGCPGVIDFEPSPSLSVREIAGLGAGKSLDLDQVGSVVVVTPRPGAVVRRKGARVLAVVYAGPDGELLEAIGGVLTTKSPSRFGSGWAPQLRRAGDAVEVRAAPSDERACPAGFTFRLRADGGVEADGRRLGSVR